MTTRLHEQLVELVNTIKVEINGSPGGVFYLNEYRQVVVPAGRPPACYYAGEYHGDLEFYFEDHCISGNMTPRPGVAWEGPHVGIPYKLTANGKDISYERKLRLNVTRDERLSAHVGEALAATFAGKLARIVGYNGGRFYINEFKRMFKPRQHDGGVEYIYIGMLEPDDPWFPRPHPEQS
jgi:hypothetical protein